MTDDQLEQSGDTGGQQPAETPRAALSPDELNTLLSRYGSAGSGGPKAGKDAAERTVQPYDFTKPKRFSKEQLRILESVHREFAAELAETLTGLTGISATTVQMNTELLTWEEYRHTLPERTLLAEAALGRDEACVSVEINPSVVGVVVDCLCGGDSGAPSSPSELTPMDLAVAGRAVQDLLEAYSRAWKQAAAVEPKLVGVSDGVSEMACVPEKCEPVAAFTFELRLGEVVGSVSLCIPARTVELLLPGSVGLTQAGVGNERIPQASPEDARRILEGVELQCRVVLGYARVSLADLTGLEAGDVIRTDRRAGAEVDFCIGDRVLFRCRPGTLGKNLGVLVTSVEESEAGELLVQPAQVHEQGPAEEALPEAA